MKTIVAAILCICLVGMVRAEDLEVGGMKSKVPEGWVAGKATDMRLAAYKLAKADGDDEGGEVVVFKFPKGSSGGVEANFKRQLARFKAPEGEKLDVKESKMNFGKQECPTQIITGTYLDRFPPFDPKAKETPKPGYKQYYVVVQTDDGDFYFRLMGPAKTVAKHEKDFTEFLKNFK